MKRFARLVLLVSLSSCAGSGKITKVEICREIPFIDAPEAACATTVVNTSRLISAEEWKKERPYYLMISAKSWTAIKLDWLAACRAAISKNREEDCNVQVESIEKVIRALDDLARKVIPLP